MRAALVTLCTAVLLPVLPAAQQSCAQDAMIVFDGSGSMAETGFNQLDEARIFAARRAVDRAIPPVAKVRRLGLVIYGPGQAGSCGNIDLRFAPSWDAADRIVGAVNDLQPAGDTPLTDAVRQASTVLDASGGVVVLVTDGKETCGGAPCQLAAELAADHPGLTVHVIGFQVRGEHFGWDSQGPNDYSDATSVAACLADRTGGQYFAAESVDDLVRALRITLGCVVIGGEIPPPLPRG